MPAKSQKDNTTRNRAKVTYPYHPLSTCIEVAKAVKEIGNGKQDVSRTLLASHLKIDEKSGDFAQKLASTKCYGLIDGRSDFRLTDISIGLFLPTEDPERQRRIALLSASRNPGAFAALLDRYDGSKPPDAEVVGNVLSQQLGIPESWKIRIAGLFTKAMETAGAISSDGFLRHKAETEKIGASKGKIVRAGLDNEATVDQEVEAERLKKKQHENLKRDADDVADQEEVIVWKYPFKGKMLRIETPEDITTELWDKLKRYIEVLQPNK